MVTIYKIVFHVVITGCGVETEFASHLNIDCRLVFVLLVAKSAVTSVLPSMHQIQLWFQLSVSTFSRQTLDK